MFNRNVIRHMSIGLVVTATLAHTAAATSDYAEVEAEGWRFAPVLENQQVKGLFAWLDESLTKDQNVRALYFTRDGNGQWQASAWKNATVEQAAAFVHLTRADAAQFDPSVGPQEAFWSCVNIQDPITPEVLVNGLFADDPYQQVVGQSTDKEALLGRLAKSGYTVAPTISEIMVAAPVNGTPKLSAFADEIAAKIELAVKGETNLPQAGLWPCSCTTTYGASTCGAWIFVCAVPSSGGGTTCHYKRTCTRPWTSTGLHWYCLSCAGTGTETYSKTGRTTVLPGDPCVPPPP